MAVATMMLQARVAAVAIAAACAWCGSPLPAAAGEWPQILGPSRNGVAAADERLADRWPAAGPRVLWQRPVGGGNAGVAVAGGRAVLFHRQGDREVIEAIDAANGPGINGRGRAVF